MKTHNLAFATLLVAAGTSLAVQAQSYPPPSYPPSQPPSDQGYANPGDNQGYGNQGYDNQGGNQGYDDQQPYYDPRPDGNYDDPGADQGTSDPGGYDNQGQGPVDESVFYNQLSPYGRWIQRGSYGWVWEPTRVAVGWRPYTQGHWVDTDYGWTWVSSEPWGWATYHYGRWTLDNEFGWLWVPGTDWGPAWVSFQEGGGYVGWAPLPPAVGFSAGIGLQLGGLSLSVGIDPYAYSFVPERAFLDDRLEILPPARNVTFIHETRNITNITVVNNRVFNRSVDESRIAQVTGRPVRHYQVAEVRNPAQGRATRVQGDRVSIFRPAISLAKPRPNVTPMAVAQQRQQRMQQAQRVQPGQPGQPGRQQQVQAVQPGQQAQVRQPGNVGPNNGRPAFNPADLPRKHQAEQQQLQARQDAERSRLMQMQEQEKSARQNQREQGAIVAQHQAEQQALQQQQQREQQMLQGRHQREQQAAQSRQQPQQQRQQPRQEPKREPQHDQKPPL